MAFTAQQIQNMANAALDYHIKDGVESQTIQDKPLLAMLNRNKKIFPGGKENITVRVKGVYDTEFEGFTHDDQVSYGNPANIKTASFPWKEIHAGIQITGTELKVDGISVVDSTDGAETTQHSEREMTALAGLLEDKIDDMKEGSERSMNLMSWRDGTQSAKEFPGIRSFILDAPTTGVTGGIDRALNSWWRNRASLALNGASTVQDVINKLQAEYRQLRRYGGKPDTFLCGSSFITAVEGQARDKGTYTQTGWAVSKDGKNARFETSMADISFKGVLLQYDPTLDDEGLAKYGYWLDSSKIQLRPMEGEDMKKHNPARPADKYVYFRAVTWTGGLIVRRLNSSGVYSIA